MLKYSKANTKLKAMLKVKLLARWLTRNRKIYSLDLLSGWSCPFAKECLSKVHVRTDGSRYIKDGPETQFRCFSASQEALFPAVYNLRKHNFDNLKAADGMLGKYELLQNSLPKDAGIVRIHVGGDFFNQDYFDAWVKMAEMNPDVLFYAYTKSLPFWLEYEYLTDNMVITASRGGRLDDMITPNKLREALVVLDEHDASLRDYEIDHDDSHAAIPEQRNQSFALLIHGVQPAGSAAGKAVRSLKGVGSYGKGTK